MTRFAEWPMTALTAGAGGSGPSLKAQQWSVAIMSTIAFTVCFAIWMMFAVIGIPIKKMLDLNATQFGLLTATPVLTGSLIRVPLGMWTDKYGGRIVFFLLMISTVIPIWLLTYATAYWHFLVLGLFVGLAGGSFSVGTPYVARWFDKKHQGFAMGVFGAGNSGAAVTKFVAPALVVAFGWAVATRSCLAATSHCRSGWSITTSASSASTSASPPCWRPASRCRAAYCAPLAAG